VVGTGLKGVALFGSTPPPSDSIWTIAKKAGFELHLEERQVQNKEKKIDTGFATMMTRDAYKFGDPTKADVAPFLAQFTQ
jgi:hypothetical protein